MLRCDSVKLASICHSLVEQDLLHLATQASGFMDRLYPDGRLSKVSSWDDDGDDDDDDGLTIVLHRLWNLELCWGICCFGAEMIQLWNLCLPWKLSSPFIGYVEQRSWISFSWWFNVEWFVAVSRVIWRNVTQNSLNFSAGNWSIVMTMMTDFTYLVTWIAFSSVLPAHSLLLLAAVFRCYILIVMCTTV